MDDPSVFFSGPFIHLRSFLSSCTTPSPRPRVPIPPRTPALPPSHRHSLTSHALIDTFSESALCRLWPICWAQQKSQSCPRFCFSSVWPLSALRCWSWQLHSVLNEVHKATYYICMVSSVHGRRVSLVWFCILDGSHEIASQQLLQLLSMKYLPMTVLVREQYLKKSQSGDTTKVFNSTCVMSCSYSLA